MSKYQSCMFNNGFGEAVAFPHLFLQRIKSFRELFGVLDSDVPMMLRKFPGLVVLEPQELRTRYDNLRELTRFNNQQVCDKCNTCEGCDMTDNV